ncbi:murein DD-endopeptidase MepM/ murein hydrolase activator NlpD [Streptomyces sp. PvR006]|uniref:LysM peptidoglycan-binding domain-containing M23 family metallopeptidase n=1 Tax=Streptomyces sp. PvR006 TaxID=2817860 RepID=UPI001AE563B2|nr:LysM peptidoglycan-binding domain-containing M23 family metallopeptidase [Streptomyces sp. PvR006]MBP2585939.1 murein DD-endopeptidase MepM/ murein hydrolase activator NlpD [Streptomyces sp. PvR006]
MPAKGKHRRIKSNRLTRGIAAAGTGGAVVALPLLGATGAHAAEQAAPAAAPGQAVTAAAQVKAPAVAKAAPAAAKAAPKTYSVVRGDYLSKIAAEHHVTGGWQKLYADNRQVVGEDPSLILPGMKLTLGAKSTAKAAAPKSAAPKAAAPKASGKNGDTSRASRSSERPAAPAADTSAAKTTQSSGSSGAATSASGWFAPVSGGMSTPYRAAGSMWSSGYHTGVDFMASTGTTIVAVGPGTVYSAGDGGAYGNQVVIQHADGTFSQYAHLSSISVSAGQTVSGGEQIGLSGATGNVTGPHLHFEIRTGPDYGSDIDPIAALRQHGVNL